MASDEWRPSSVFQPRRQFVAVSSSLDSVSPFSSRRNLNHWQLPLHRKNPYCQWLMYRKCRSSYRKRSTASLRRITRSCLRNASMQNGSLVLTPRILGRPVIGIVHLFSASLQRFPATLSFVVWCTNCHKSNVFTIFSVLSSRFSVLVSRKS